MRTTTAIASLLAAAACASASSASHPVLAFTSQQASNLQLELPSDSSIDGFVDTLFAAGKSSPACKLDAIATVWADHLDRDMFASLRHTSSDSLRARSIGAPSQVTFGAAPNTNTTAILVERIVSACRFERYSVTQLSDLTRNQEVSPPDQQQKTFPFVEILVHDLPRQEAQLLKALESLDEKKPRNLVMVMQNGQLHQHTKRQYVAAPSSSSGNWTEPAGGIFARYQLFSTPLILTLLLVGGVLLPIVYFAVAQLAQVQTPDQMGVRKDPISGEKKSQ
ncbi:uncharacterized protein UBRO_00170 [Ustilago bromivora]|uniref:Protein BIG1 n=1 Tax=Ustilago bromivora TaxID=307758 RepID=A0A1K0FY48_9BASI|nr:uncharacterized protein UBRO_00170 [Ustilago bromivora]SYW75870.1 uncharacterized protein UBRO2_01025 [Ustilago bromivora]